MRWLIALGFISAALAVEPVRLQPYPQKFRTFYRHTDLDVPVALRSAVAAIPVGDVTALASGPYNDLWIGTRQGLILYQPQAPVEDRYQYLAGKRYLPDDEVDAVHAPGLGNGYPSVWVRTKTGVSRIDLQPMSLARKAAYFEQRIQERHDRWGMVADSSFTEPGNPKTNRTHDNDNDGLWTAMYAAAKCFEYSVTGSAEALARAKRATEAVLFLTDVTGRPGFPARSYIKKGETRGKGGEWHWTPDGEYEWKADTSSDEIVGHFFIFAIAYDLLPDPALKARIVKTATAIMDHIIQNGYHLIDLDGKPTLWGKWSPEYFATKNGKADSPLNALELLSFLRTTHHLTGGRKYEDEYQKVALKMKYLELTTKQMEYREEINYSDEELAMLPFYLIFRYEKDPKFLEVYRRAMDGWWHNIWREKNPLWTFIYLTGQPHRPVDLQAAVWTLYRIPMDLIRWGVKNSHRKDVVMESNADRFKRPQSANLLPSDERPVMKWNGNPFIIDGGGNGSGEDDGAFFLLPYWMGRYHGFLIGE